MKDERRSAGEADSDMGGQQDDGSRLAALLAGAVRDGAVDPGAEERALAAFRRARDRGTHGAVRTRRRDDWRPAGERRRGWPVRTTLVALAAGAALGGVAFAAIGPGIPGMGAHHEGAGRDRPRPSSSAPAGPRPGAGTGTPGPSAPGTTGGPGGSSDRPAAAQDTEAHCRAYESAGKNGKVLDPAAWQRLIRAAGGADDVEAYCAAQLKEPKKAKKSKEPKKAKASNGSTEKKEKKEKEKKEKKDTGDIKPSKPAKVSKSSGGKGATKDPKNT
ncbi:hypothetical protein QFZ75_002984 [Streptomyces sp. V3I8]|uniref:hypothetical protein n=1 Tax=Streptomyces sp. V3I8 TaxID=3042279 RepID=UPI002780A303|nr:hypothetical protein [Streptomyces sp. V3I8]MDQ1036568.1 hypothetical protein [Streptomyces sp. V3I8]